MFFWRGLPPTGIWPLLLEIRLIRSDSAVVPQGGRGLAMRFIVAARIVLQRIEPETSR